MGTKYIHVNWTFDRVALARDMEIWRQDNNLTMAECDELMGTVNWWSNVVADDTKAYREHYKPSLRLIEKAINLCSLDPREYWSFDDRKMKRKNQDA